MIFVSYLIVKDCHTSHKNVQDIKFHKNLESAIVYINNSIATATTVEASVNNAPPFLSNKTNKSTTITLDNRYATTYKVATLEDFMEDYQIIANANELDFKFDGKKIWKLTMKGNKK